MVHPDLTSERILEALGELEDPELRRPVLELGMIPHVDVDGDRVRVQVALTSPGHPWRDVLLQTIESTVGSVPGVASVSLDVDVMDEDATMAMLESIGVDASDSPGRQSIFQTGESKARIVAISSGKGGVGKSSITTNLAVALADQGKRVGVVDADVWGFSIPRMLGIDRPPNVIGPLIIPPDAHGVRCVSIGFFVDEDQAVVWRGPMLHKAMEQFLTDVYWGDLDFLLIDMPPGTGDISISLSQFLPTAEVVVVTTPQPAAQRVAQRAGAMAEKVNQRILGVIENMSWLDEPGGGRRHLFGEGGGALLAKQLDVPLLGQVPLDEALREGADEGRPVVVSDPRSPAAKVLVEMAATIAATPRTKIRRPELRIT